MPFFNNSEIYEHGKNERNGGNITEKKASLRPVIFEKKVN